MREFLKNNPIAIGIVIMSLLYVLIILYFMIDREKYETYFVYSDIANFKCSNIKCEEITNEELEKLSLTYNLIYSNGSRYNGYSLKSGKVWNVFDSDGNYLNNKDDFFAYDTSQNLEVYELESHGISRNEEQYIEKELKDEILNPLENITFNQVYELNLNNKKNLDKLVIVSNFDEENILEKIYNFGYVEIDGKRTILFKDIYNKSNILNMKDYYLINVYEIDNDIYFSIKQTGYYNPSKTKVDIYKVHNTKINKLN